jgi:23S rRNA pseudouridine1911/1915/1917 synthase
MTHLFKIIQEDNDIIIIDKPAGLRVDHDPNGLDSVEDTLSYQIERHGIVHRIDKDTSGLLIIAKTNDSLENLKKQFQEHSVTKVYTTLVLGQTEKEGTIELPIARDPARKQAMRALKFTTGDERGKLREAITHYKLGQNYKLDKEILSLLNVEIETGRTHQIRAHMQAIGHPIIGDQMYKNKTSKKISTQLDLNRQFLHARSLKFKHPRTDKEMSLQSPLPADLSSVLEELIMI